MSGHSKWHSIKHKKGAIDAKRGKIFTRHSNLITLAARSGGADPATNATLRLAIENAKKENVPNANIEKAIKRGTGALKEGAEIGEACYEGYGPGGVAIMAECLTDNKNRTLTNIRTAFSKGGGSLGGAGSVGYLFERKGVITLNIEKNRQDEAELLAIDAGAEDIRSDDNLVTVYVKPAQVAEIAEKLKKYGPENAEVRLVPKNTVEITDGETAKKVMALIDTLEDDPDISNVSSNFDISESLMETLQNG